MIADVERQLKLRAEMVQVLTDVSMTIDAVQPKDVVLLQKLKRQEKIVGAFFTTSAVILLSSTHLGTTASRLSVALFFCALSSVLTALAINSDVKRK
jgi:hypothetical protein